MREMMETLESRRLYSAAAIATAPSAHVEPSATTTIALAAGKFKGSSVSTKGFTTRLTMTLGKERAGGTIIGTFDYLSGFDFEMHLAPGRRQHVSWNNHDGHFRGDAHQWRDLDIGARDDRRSIRPLFVQQRQGRRRYG